MFITNKTLIFSGYGLNCEEETQYAFATLGTDAEIVHINDLIDGHKKLNDYQILVFPGGFSYGDDTGAGRAYANLIKNHLYDDLLKCVREEKLILGICNGFQILTNLGLLPGTLVFNDNAKFIDRWVDLEICHKNNVSGFSNGIIDSPWLKGVDKVSLPIAHAEGKYYADVKTLESLKANGQIAARYIYGDICEYQDLEANPNGSLENIAAVQSVNGKILGMMPHPERAVSFTQLPNWPYLKEKCKRENKPMPTEGPGMVTFKNALEHCSKRTIRSF